MNTPRKLNRRLYGSDEKVGDVSSSSEDAPGDGTPGAATKASPISSAQNVQELRQRKFIIDSGASYHAIGRKQLTNDEKSRIKRLDQPQPLNAAKELAYAYDYVLVPVRELNNLMVKALILEETPCLLSNGQLCLRDGFFIQLAGGTATSSLT